MKEKTTLITTSVSTQKTGKKINKTKNQFSLETDNKVTVDIRNPTITTVTVRMSRSLKLSQTNKLTNHELTKCKIFSEQSEREMLVMHVSRETAKQAVSFLRK